MSAVFVLNSRLGTFACRYARTIIATTFLITLVLGYFAIQIDIDADIEAIVPEGDNITGLMDAYGDDLTNYQYLLVAIEPAESWTVPLLNTFVQTIESIESLEAISSSINPFNFTTFAINRGKLVPAPLVPNGTAPQNQAELEAMIQKLGGDQFASEVVVSKDVSTLCVYFTYDEKMNTDLLMAAVDEKLEPLRSLAHVYYTGYPEFTRVTRQLLIRDFSRLLIFAIIFIMFLYYIGFRSKRAVFLPLVLVIIGTIWSIGFMRLLGYSLTIFSIVTPPIVLTMGSSYAIHVLNQYFRDNHAATDPAKVIPGAIARISRTVLLASLTTVVGFLSLQSMRIDKIQEFGLGTSFGIISCALLSLVFLPATLSLMKMPDTASSKDIRNDGLTRLMARVAGFNSRNFGWILLFLVVVIGVFVPCIPLLETQTNYMEYFPNDLPIIQDSKRIHAATGGFQPLTVTLHAPDDEAGYFLDLDVLRQVSELEARLLDHELITSVTSFPKFLRQLNQLAGKGDALPENRGMILLLSRYIRMMKTMNIAEGSVGTIANEDFSVISLVFKIRDPEGESIFVYDAPLKKLVTEMETIMSDQGFDAYRPDIWGNSLRFAYIGDQLIRDQYKSIFLSMLIVFLISTAFFRSPVCGVLSLLPMGTGIMLNIIMMVLLKIPMDMTNSMVSCMAIGVGVDNSIHFLIQYRRQRRHYPDDVKKALYETMTITGRPITLTSLSIVGGMLVLVLATFKPIIYFGALISTALTTTLLGTLIILPAFITGLSFLKGRFLRSCR